jgi:O-antigen/teichoic acid export membrane protein
MSEPSLYKEVSANSITKNTIWNLIGQITPLIAAIITIPLLISSLGIDRFGVLTLAWMVIGYFSLFDLGLGRALIKLVSECIGSDNTNDLVKIIWTALLLMCALGLLGMVTVLALSNILVTSVLNIPSDIQVESSESFKLLAWSVPIVILTTGLRGILEAYQRFDLVNVVRIPLGVLTFVVPILVLPFSNRLDLIVAALLILRIFVLFIHIILCHYIVPQAFHRFAYSRPHAWRMLSFGGWMTVTNVLGPMMIYLDRFVIGSALSMAAVTFYVAPFEIITKALIVPGAIVGVLFPAFAANLKGNPSRILSLFDSGVRLIFLILFPTALLAIIFANDALQFWLSGTMPPNSSSVLQWLAGGVLLNGLAHVPFAFIQSAGRPDLTAKLHLIECPLYFLALWLALDQWGLVGAAIVWTIRAGIDAVAMFIISFLINKELKGVIKSTCVTVLLGMMVLPLGAIPSELITKIIFAIFFIICFVLIAWHYQLTLKERIKIKEIINRRLNNFYKL